MSAGKIIRLPDPDLFFSWSEQLHLAWVRPIHHLLHLHLHPHYPPLFASVPHCFHCPPSFPIFRVVRREMMVLPFGPTADETFKQSCYRFRGEKNQRKSSILSGVISDVRLPLIKFYSEEVRSGTRSLCCLWGAQCCETLGTDQISKLEAL